MEKTKTTKQEIKQPDTSRSQVSVKSENGEVTNKSEKELKKSTVSLNTPREGPITNGTASVEEKKKLNGKQKFSGKSTLVNSMGSSTTLSSAAGTEASDEPDDHINVVLRVRPLNMQELTRRDVFHSSFPGSGTIEVDHNSSMRSFTYNVVFEPEATQEDLFDHSGVRKLVDMAMNGYACTALAFGQTGSGKTHTMTGPPQQFQDGKQIDPKMYGLIQRSLFYLFKQLEQQSGSKRIRASYLEIYNEQVIDLLNANHGKYLQVRWSKNRGFYVENLFLVECETVDDLMVVLEEGMRNRQTGSHGLNEFSSRSHSMLTLTIDSEQTDPDDENLAITKRGKLTFVDLAGIEKVKDSNSTAESLFESNNINKSLLVLGNCIASLGDAKKRHGHIPYRDSKLTKLLADSLGGNGVTLMVACITPSSHQVSETMNTLRYASRAKKIKTKPVVKMDPREKLIVNLKKEIKVLRNENIYLRQQLEFPAKPKEHLQKENDEKFLKFLKEQTKEPITPKQKESESGLYEMLQEYMVENEALRTENADMHAFRDKSKREQQLMYRENEKLGARIENLEKMLQTNNIQWQAARANPPPEPMQDPNRGSPHYSTRPPHGSGTSNRSLQGRLAPQDMSYTGQPQGYSSPNGRPRQGPPPGQGQPKRPPHRLAEPIQHVQRPGLIPYETVQNGAYPADSYDNPRLRASGHPRQESPVRNLERRPSQLSTTEVIKNMNDKLRTELRQLEGEISQNELQNRRTKEIVYGSQQSIR
ncbi:hypothetical protein ScPMuIL_005538 [Solemya velum]